MSQASGNQNSIMPESCHGSNNEIVQPSMMGNTRKQPFISKPLQTRIVLAQANADQSSRDDYFKDLETEREMSRREN